MPAVVNFGQTRLHNRGIPSADLLKNMGKQKRHANKRVSFKVTPTYARHATAYPNTKTRNYLDLANVRNAFADTITVCILPSISMRRRCRFGFQVRLLDLIEKVRL